MTSKKILLQTTKLSTSAKSPIFKMAKNHHGAQFHMSNQNSNASNLYIVGMEILSGLIMYYEIGSKNGHILSY